MMVPAMTELSGRDFLDIADLDAGQLRRLLDLAHEIKAGRRTDRPLERRHIALVFQKPSHRTRVSFEVGVGRLGGTWTTLNEQEVQLGVRETVGDAARVLDHYVDGIVARLRSHKDLLEMASASEKPVINALTDRSHPCQVLADVLTLEEVGGPLEQQHLAFVGDGNNVATSMIEAATLLGFALTVITPPGYEPSAEALTHAKGLNPNHSRVTVTNDLAAVRGATAVYTDVWASMGQESERAARNKAFAAYQVNEALMRAAEPGARFLHCLPAHRGEEVSAEVIDGPHSVVFQQAGNRLYAQMALMSELFGR
jgi:ornithine carbamoyltransferase